MNAASKAGLVWRLLVTTQLRDQPLRLMVTVVAIALGVALGASVYLVNTAALNEFGLASKRLVGEADVIIRGQRSGFPESVFVQLARDPLVADASPVLELEAAVPGRRDTLKILGIDPFRAAALQPLLMAEIGGAVTELFQPDRIYLSSPAAAALQLRRGDSLTVIVGSEPKTLRIEGILTPDAYSQALGLMDIASAQWLFGSIGRLNRVDLRLIPGTSVAAFRQSLGKRLPPGILAVAPAVERDRAVTVTRAYRVNLNMLALVALWTGAFLVFSTQSLSVLRRRRSFALLRALGVTRGELQRALVGEGAALGAVGSLLGVLLGVLLAALMLRALTGDLGNGQLHADSVLLNAPWLPLLGFFFIGTLVSALGAWIPSRAAARQPTARALKGGDAGYAALARHSWLIGLALLTTGAALARMPAVSGLPVFGYAAVGALLFGAVLLVPIITVRALGMAPRTGRVVLDTAVAQLRENVGLSTLSLASIIVSFSLMVAMAVMVYSFRQSFDDWLVKLLPADMQLRGPLGNDTASFSADVQRRLAAVAGVARMQFRCTVPLLLDPEKPPVTLIARSGSAAEMTQELPLLKTWTKAAPSDSDPAWISEALQDLYHYQLGQAIELPLGGQAHRFVVAGVWRDYARAFGAIAITRTAYIRLTGDGSATEGSAWLRRGVDASAVETAMRATFARGDSLEILTSTALRARSLRIFDRAFAITYVLEAIAVIIGLTGVSFAASSTALSRRAEFGVLRHLGMRRRQVIELLASEGLLTSVFGAVYGLLLGGALSLVLVFVVNRQSFNWSIDLSIPEIELGVLTAVLIVAATLTAVGSGRAATSQEAVNAVREDW